MANFNNPEMMSERGEKIYSELNAGTTSTWQTALGSKVNGNCIIWILLSLC